MKNDDECRMMTFGDALSQALENAQHAYTIQERCESPIEVELGAALRRLCGDKFDIVPQYKFQRFRMDFAIVDVKTKKPLVFIECDGKEFHSTTSQITNDRLKDRAAYGAGVYPIRFTGARILRNPSKCAAEALERANWALIYIN